MKSFINKEAKVEPNKEKLKKTAHYFDFHGVLTSRDWRRSPHPRQVELAKATFEYLDSQGHFIAIISLGAEAAILDFLKSKLKLDDELIKRIQIRAGGHSGGTGFKVSEISDLAGLLDENEHSIFSKGPLFKDADEHFFYDDEEMMRDAIGEIANEFTKKNKNLIVYDWKRRTSENPYEYFDFARAQCTANLNKPNKDAKESVDSVKNPTAIATLIQSRQFCRFDYTIT